MFVAANDFIGGRLLGGYGFWLCICRCFWLDRGIVLEISAAIVGAVFTPIGALIAAAVVVIIAAGFTLWKYWDRFSFFVKGFTRGLIHVFGRAFKAMMRFGGADTVTIAKWKNVLADAFDFS